MNNQKNKYNIGDFVFTELYENVFVRVKIVGISIPLGEGNWAFVYSFNLKNLEEVDWSKAGRIFYATNFPFGHDIPEDLCYISFNDIAPYIRPIRIKRPKRILRKFYQGSIKSLCRQRNKEEAEDCIRYFQENYTPFKVYYKRK